MIHPTVIIDPKAELAPDVNIGAYSVIGADVHIDSGTTIAPHVVIEGPTRIGKNNHIYPFASLGAAPQDKKYGGEATTLQIGDNNTIREYTTFNRGTVQDIGTTILGNDNWIMAYVHLAHDCVIGNDTTFANNVTLAGHVHIEDHVVMGGFALVYQFVHIGAYTMVGYCAGVKQNVAPYSLVVESPARIAGIIAAKRTSDMIPLCHPLPLAKCTLNFALEGVPRRAVRAEAAVKVTGETGVEMEALHAVSTALLTIYDMCKAIDKRMEIGDIRLERKSGGKSGTFVR